MGGPVWVQVCRRRPSWGGGGTHVWEGGSESAVIHGVLTWARTGRWRMRQAELSGRGAVWVGGVVTMPLGSPWRTGGIHISRSGWGAVGGTEHRWTESPTVTKRLQRARRGHVHQLLSTQRPVSADPRFRSLCPCNDPTIPGDSTGNWPLEYITGMHTTASV